MDILSPLTGIHSTVLEQEIPVSTIVAKYRALGLDVTRFFSNVEEVQIRRCAGSSYRFYYPYDIFGDDRFYTELQDLFPTYYVERWEHQVALAELKPGAKVLEIGSGSGFFLEELKKKNVDGFGLELNRDAVKIARNKGLKIEHQLLHEHAPDNIAKYDAVCSFQVLEHISHVGDYFAECIKILKPGGKVIIGVPNNNPYIFKHEIHHTLNLPPHHSGLWNKESLAAVANFYDLDVEKVLVEPLSEYKEWYQAQVNFYKQDKPLLASILQLVPRPVYKLYLKLLRNRIEGRNVLVVYKKR